MTNPPSSKRTTCDNPMCSCDPCGCATCTCGVTRIGELERRVMTILWDVGDERELTGRQVADTLPEYAYTTVATVLDRLVHKGLVRRHDSRRPIRFSANGSQGAHTAVLMHETLADADDRRAALARFTDMLSTEEAVELRSLLDAKDGNATNTHP